VIGLRYVSWGDTTGYAVAAKAYLRLLADAGVPVTWTPMRPGRRRYRAWTGTHWPEPDLQPLCNRPLVHDTVLIHTVPEYYPDWIAAARAGGHRVFGYTVWELERLPGHWPAILNQLDGVLVPCHWNADTFRRAGVTVPIHVVPHLSQFEGRPRASAAAHAALAARLGAAPGTGDFLFYTIGTWSARKAPERVVEAFLEAFTADDPVSLVVKTSRNDVTRARRRWWAGFRMRYPSPRRAVRALAARFARPPRIVCIADETLSDDEMLALHERGDCFVSLARAEGWGLGAFEAARRGTPVVMTGYGGQRDFLDPALSRLLAYEMVPVDEPFWRRSYRGTDRWAEPSLAEAVAHMRAIARDPAPARRQAAALAARNATRFSPAAILAALRAALA
jgi:glycosyltransferase involved in cell wall biosynthesis